MYFFLLNLGFGEIFIILLIYLIFFGSKNFPSLMKDIGRVFYKIKNSIDDIYRDFDSDFKN
ncbi:MAG: twin-arginine translocase TatA/TatE family subunit [Flavobacteriales bacterium]|jgi:Sec-independent protein translocase protein TatA|nr:twin-arginine translocase TatA/TatE family subunit [Flavobacteriales bacterium]|tara:strand:+ start:1552 stop:1734 length:183 start_codon:yes stop_codon:yes gene_type:complete